MLACHLIKHSVDNGIFVSLPCLYTTKQRTKLLRCFVSIEKHFYIFNHKYVQVCQIYSVLSKHYVNHTQIHLNGKSFSMIADGSLNENRDVGNSSVWIFPTPQVSGKHENNVFKLFFFLLIS